MKTVTCLIILMSGLLFSSGGLANLNGLEFVESASGRKSANTRELVQWTHSRLVFSKPLERVAVGQQETLQVEILDNNEVLALAKKVGRTSLMVWYSDNTSETFLFSVVEDLSVLRSALRDIHHHIQLTLAPDRAALVLRGNVPTMKVRNAAEAAARHYLDAGQMYGTNNSGVVVQANSGSQQHLGDNTMSLSHNTLNSGPNQGSKAAIINLLQVDELPLSIEEKVKKAIDQVGGDSVKVSRIQQGDISSDLHDSLLLSGHVETQVELVRVLNLAARLIDSNGASPSQAIEILANESGGITGQDMIRQSGNFSGNGSLNFDNQVTGNNLDSNVGRAKMLSVAGGRILSTIEVRDLPQVRVSVQMYEVNRRKLKQWRPDFSLISTGYDNNNGLFGLNGASSSAQGAGDVENALQVLGGALVNNLQIGGSEIAFDLLFSMMEEAGISRTLSRPNLTVLAGESAVFRAGGEVPVPTAFAPSGFSGGDDVGPNTSGVFSGTQFKAFGVQLSVRALVDENDRITLDLNPTISLPDTLLTQDIANSTGTALNTSAFNVRSLNTSTRLNDGQPLIIGGLVSRDIGDNRDFVPGANQIPLLGKLAESSVESDMQRELIIIVTPTLIRESRHDTELWQFPHPAQLMSDALNP